jgi:hypothetical protein
MPACRSNVKEVKGKRVSASGSCSDVGELDSNLDTLVRSMLGPLELPLDTSDGTDGRLGRLQRAFLQASKSGKRYLDEFGR